MPSLAVAPDSYEEEILALRRLVPDAVRPNYGTTRDQIRMKVHLDTVHNFVKVRLACIGKIRGSDLRAGPSSKIPAAIAQARNPSGQPS